MATADARGRTLAVFGPGKVGEAIGRLALAAGWDVLYVGSPRHTSLQPFLDVSVPGSVAVGHEDAARRADVIVLAVPYGAARTLPWHLFADRLVVDAMNRWPPVDWSRTPLPERSTSEEHALLNPRMRLAKTLNHLGFGDLEDDSLPAGDPLRRTLAFATDHDRDRATLIGLLDDLGFDALDLGPLAEGRWLEPGFAGFGRDLDAAGFRAAIAKSRSLYGNG
ncbi:NADPH-dependent F420 reductase [Propionicicella superfundia]|uniref:NADPH-dependent F420 reductase n=1 Tax=Propionicicella superfundia TaxID=348582 RepID=UPI0003FFF816|nr:NAD(P)-binding domain-containing protein [Propionicicella superfundia]